MNVPIGSVRTTVVDGEAMLAGKDVAEILGYTNPLKAIRDHVDEEDKGVNEMDTPRWQTGNYLYQRERFLLTHSQKSVTTGEEVLVLGNS